ncbi:MAG: hypothetical protein U1F10_15975 [Burkholderiales bacterium]
MYRAIVAEGGNALQIRDTEVVPGRGIIGGIIASGRAEHVNDASSDARAIPIAGTEDAGDERFMVAHGRARAAPVKGAMAVWRNGGKAFTAGELGVPRRPSLPLRWRWRTRAPSQPSSVLRELDTATGCRAKWPPSSTWTR